ncbi:amino acid ABC transporter ATP-binding protein [Acidaminobacter sp. JC074]|uniref:amino acid ABC transporter ATP-binding protein n=1 Tax=Acidaminobacter sp. JC074 TaxID=2530199 RepID=UPI001F0EBA25|nr:amino acid ABC transporter ATP-binding protein [Acidaminobacter sp. JC074]MCH4886722.1 amino acid ABC transporter ATP-binding protein [Acidaminobacter sp. JC074]
MITLKDVHKSFDDLKVLNGISFTMKKGEIISVIGSSGSGKSTLLRVINGLESASRGHMKIDDDTFDLSTMHEKDKRRIRKRVSMVFQNYNLFKHKTALENVIEGLIVDGMKKDKAIELGISLLDKVGLVDRKNHYPSQLSGGQQQRVGIARALALKPQVILFDEPTSALDPELVQEVLSVIRKLVDESVTILIVTHEMTFAKEISDRIVFMSEGVIEVDTHPQALYQSNNNKLRAFLGKADK